MAPPYTRDQLSGMTAAALQTAINDLKAQVIRLHHDERGEVREKTEAEHTEFNEALDLVQRAEMLLQIRQAYDRQGGQAGFGVTLTGATTAFGDDAASVLRMAADEARSKALRALEARGRDLPADQGDRVDKLLRSRLSEENKYCDGSWLARRTLISESPAYRSAWKQLMTEDHPLLTAEEIESVRAMKTLDIENRGMNEGTGSAGGFGVPVFLDASILLSSGSGAAPLLDVARVVPVTSNVWKGVSSAPPTFSWDLESAEVSDDSPTLAQPSITVYMTRGFIPFSIEVEMDYAATFATEMQDLMNQGYLDIAASTTATGTGSNQPFGVITKLDATASSEVTLTTAGSLGAVDVFKVWNQVPERFRSRATWAMSVSVESQIRSFSSANQSSSYFTVDLTADGITRLNGRPVVVTDNFPTLVSGTSHQNQLVVGDFKSFVVAQRLGLTTERVPLLLGTTNNRPTGERGMFCYARFGSDVAVTNGLRILNQT
jgi:HK97 family phage major capsid protein